MRTRSSALSLVAWGLFGLSALSARSARADTSCASDADCVKGWACQVTGSSGCGYACAAGQECPPPPDCPTQDVKSCVPGPCTADSDCATGMVCFTRQLGCDAVPPCAAGADCPTTTCTPTTQSECIPRYDAPCTVDADCGAGFSCIADGTNCSCTGGGSAPSADGGAAPPAPPTTCDCPPATTSSCHALPVVCNTAADCTAGWTCEEVATPGTCVSAPAEGPQPGANSSAGGGGTPPAEDAGVDPCPPPPPALKLCLPPYYSLGGGSLGVSESGAGTPTSGNAGSTSTSVPKSPEANDSAGQTSTAAGCSVAHGSNGAASGLALLALSLFGFARRRRAAS